MTTTKPTKPATLRIIASQGLPGYIHGNLVLESGHAVDRTSHIPVGWPNALEAVEGSARAYLVGVRRPDLEITKVEITSGARKLLAKEVR